MTTIVVECDRCDASFGADWSAAPQSVAGAVLNHLAYGALIYVYLPEGWSVDYLQHLPVIHCPNHTETT